MDNVENKALRDRMSDGDIEHLWMMNGPCDDLKDALRFAREVLRIDRKQAAEQIDERAAFVPQTYAGFAAVHLTESGHPPDEQQSFDAGVRAGLARTTTQQAHKGDERAAALPPMPEHVLADMQSATKYLEMWAKGEALYAPKNGYDEPGVKSATISDVKKSAKYLAPRLREASFALQDYFFAIDAARAAAPQAVTLSDEQREAIDWAIGQALRGYLGTRWKALTALRRALLAAHPTEKADKPFVPQPQGGSRA